MYFFLQALIDEPQSEEIEGGLHIPSVVTSRFVSLLIDSPRVSSRKSKNTFVINS